MEREKFVGVETLKEIIKVKFKDGEDTFFKKYQSNDIEIIKDVEKEQDDLEELEKLEELDKKNND